MNTECYCQHLDALDLKKAIRAIHMAFLQLRSLEKYVDCGFYDNHPALAALEECLVKAGHIGFLGATANREEEPFEEAP